MRQLRQVPAELLVLQARVEESAYDRAGGPPYDELRAAMETAQKRYFTGLRGDRRRQAESIADTLPTEIDRLQTAFFASRQRHAAEVERVQRAAAHAYWKTLLPVL